MPTVDQIRHRITPRPTTVTSTVDGRDHLISEPAMAAGLVAGQGEYVALCGRGVVAAPLVVPPGLTCFDCETALHRIIIVNTGRSRRRGVLARLLRWRPRFSCAHPSAGGQMPVATNR